MSDGSAGEHPPPDDHWFAIIARGDSDEPLDIFVAPGWTPAIETYVARMWNGDYPVPVSLRRARLSEINLRAHGDPDAPKPVGNPTDGP